MADSFIDFPVLTQARHLTARLLAGEPGGRGFESCSARESVIAISSA